jgi:glycosyltransferase involved in cell wall biosynthesis
MAGARISVVTPSFNQAEYLEQTIDSVLSQGIADLEYIVMDGGSTDGSPQIIRRHEKHLAYWQSRPDGGQAQALQAGFQRCTGDILCWLNSDDTYTPGTLKKVRERFLADERRELVYADYLVLYPDGRLEAKPKISFDFDICLAVFLMIPQPSAFWSRRVYEAVGGLDCRYRCAFDYDLFLRIGRQARGRPAAIEHVHDYWSVFRVHPASKSVAQRQVFREEQRSIRSSFGFPRFRPWRKTVQLYQLARALAAFHAQRGLVPTKKDKGKA